MTHSNVIPRFLSTEYDTSTTTFRLMFDERFLKEAETTPYGNIAARKKLFPNLIWNPNEHARLGINGCLVFESPLVYQYPLSCFYKNPRPCPACNGTGYDNDCTCFSYRRTSIIHDDDTEARGSFDDFGFSLHIISDILRGFVHPFNKPDGKPFVPKIISDTQRMMFFIDEAGGLDSDIRGWLRNDVVTAARTFTDKEAASVCRAMHSVSTRLYTDRPQHYEYEFRFYHENHFELQVPGSHCALILGERKTDWQSGQELYCHNVDGRPSQIMLLAGLAKIDQIANKQIAESSPCR